MEPSWQPANDLEYALRAAIDEGDTQTYARLILDGVFCVPVLSDPGTPEQDVLRDHLQLGERDLLVFTSSAELRRYLGPLAQGHRTASFAELSADRLIIDPGLPIGAVLPPGVVAELAAGRQPVVPMAEVANAVQDEFRTTVRLMVLDEFAGDREPRAGLPPSSALETALAAALADRDEDAYLRALVAGEVVVPTTGPVPANEMPGIPPLPWRLAGTEEVPVVTVFSSAAMLAEVVGADHHHTTDLLFNVFIRWPDEHHVLCFNPGADTEVILSGAAVLELVDAIAEELSSGGGAS